MRSDLPDGMPSRMAKLPLSERGYPVPWFVQWLEEQGSDTPTPIGEGYPEFRMMRGEALDTAIVQKRCWICGEPLGRFMSFVLGPMCAINRTTAEPPSHRDCAEWSAKACPFLSRPQMVRREAGLTENVADMAGHGILRNPKVALVWTCEGYKLFPDPNGKKLIQIGPATDVAWFSKGREATREEVLESIDSGMPLLEEGIVGTDEEQDAARLLLKSQRDGVVEKLLPA